MKTALLFLAFTSTLLAQMNVLIFSGSTRKDSYNQTLAKEAAAEAKLMGANVTMIDLKNYSMPFYDADLEKKGLPRSAKKFRDLMVASDAIVIATPEYNGSIPGLLKNALDWASRSESAEASRSAFKGKRFALLSASPGRLGGARALVHLKALIEEVGGKVINKQVAVPGAHSALEDAELPVLRERIREQLKELFEG